MTAPELEALRTELIQTAAVCVAAIEDIDYGVANAARSVENQGSWTFRDQCAAVIWQVRGERIRQDEKWGPQHHKIADWLAILGEEYGEACHAYLDDIFNPTKEHEKRIGPKPIRWSLEADNAE